MANTVVYEEAWVTKLQERLKLPTNWKEVCNVEYTNNRVLNNPYMSTTPSVQDGTRGTAYTYQDFALTNESITINTYKNLPMFIDRADLAQSSFANQMELATRQAQLINERLETAMLASHADWTDFDNATIGGAAGNITVSASNIDDIIRAVIREIQEGNGWDLAARNGIFIIWRPADFEILTALMQANGFSMADVALKDGAIPGVRYMGVEHYISNSHASGHLFAGVKKLYHLGILKATYGQIVITQDPPATGGGAVSGIGIVARVDYAFKKWNTVGGLLFDVLVN